MQSIEQRPIDCGGNCNKNVNRAGKKIITNASHYVDFMSPSLRTREKPPKNETIIC